MRRKERQLSNTKSIEILENGEFGIMASIGKDDYPYTTPLNYVYYNGFIYFHTASEGHKIDNIENNNKVSFCITYDVKLLIEKFGVKYKSVIIFGKASEVFEAEKHRVLIALIKKYSGQFSEKGEKYIQGLIDKTRVFKIEIEHMTGKSNI